MMITLFNPSLSLAENELNARNEGEKHDLFRTLIASCKTAITVEEAALLASVPPNVIREWAKDYDFPSFKHGERGGKRLISKRMFDEYVDKRTKLRIGESGA